MQVITSSALMDLPRNSGLQETHEHGLVQACLCLKEHQGRGSESLVKLELISTPFVPHLSGPYLQQTGSDNQHCLSDDVAQRSR